MPTAALAMEVYSEYGWWRGDLKLRVFLREILREKVLFLLWVKIPADFEPLAG